MIPAKISRSLVQKVPIVLTLLSLSTITFAQNQTFSVNPPQTSEANDSTSPTQGATQSAQRDSTQKPVTCGGIHLAQCVKDLGRDQAGIWTSPLRISAGDALWLLPFAGATGVALHYDAQAQQNLGIDQTRINVSTNFSDAALYGSIGGTAAVYLLGAATHNDHLAETGRLGEEAIVNSLLVVEAFKLATNRQRPYQANGRGDFWPDGTRSYQLDGSFPSGHAAATFAIARVVASEYPSKAVKLAAYAFAFAVSASRVTAREHFPSEVLVGGTFGYLIGGYVVRHHAAYDQESAISITPLVEQSTRTYGLHVQFTPADLNFGKFGKFIGGIEDTR